MTPAYVWDLLHLKQANLEAILKRTERYIRDAFTNKNPEANLERLYGPIRWCKMFQTSSLWQNFMLLLSYFFVIVLFINSWEQNTVNIIQVVIIVLFVIDFIIQTYHKQETEYSRTKRDFQKEYYIKSFIIMFAILDKVFQFWVLKSDILRPFLIFRTFILLFYDPAAKRAFVSLIYTYKDIIIYISYEGVIMIVFSIVVNQVAVIKQGQQVAQFTEEYNSLQKTIFIMYILSSYDAYPDNQLVLIENQEWIYAIFIVFIFLNFFFFVTIPTSILFNSFNETYQRIVTFEQMNKKQLLYWAYCSLLYCQKESGKQIDFLDREFLCGFLKQKLWKNKKNSQKTINRILDKIAVGDQIPLDNFINLCDICESRKCNKPPTFAGWQLWVKLHDEKIQQRCTEIINSKAFTITTCVFILCAFINCIVSIYTNIKFFDSLDNAFTGIYLIEVFFKMFGLGLEKFFQSPSNKLDFFLITIGMVLNVLPHQMIPHNSDVLFKIFRIFRITDLIKILTKNQKSKTNGIYYKYKRLASQIAITITIVIRFLPLYLIALQILGSIGLIIFHSIPSIHSILDSQFADYAQYSNFNSYLGSFYVLIQVLFEAGWSNIAFDHAFRYNHYLLVMLYFVFSHLLLVVILSELMKGISWTVYAAICKQYSTREKQKELERVQLQYKTLTYRQKLEIQKNNGIRRWISIKIKSQFKWLQLSEKINNDQDQIQSQSKVDENHKPSSDHIVSNLSSHTFRQDSEYIIDESGAIGTNYITSKFTNDSEISTQFMHALKKHLKTKQINNYKAYNPIMRKQQANVKKDLRIEDAHLLSTAFLTEQYYDWNKKMIPHYFQDVYQDNFHRFCASEQSSFISSCFSVMKSFNYSMEFFKGKQLLNILLLIEAQINQELLPKGSIFKFIFQLRDYKQHWIMLSGNQHSIQVDFIQSRYWIYDEQMEQNTIYCGKDVFERDYSRDELVKADEKEGMKRLLANFESLSLSLGSDKPSFFQYNPIYQEYNALYIVNQLQEKENQKRIFNIGKVMQIVLINRGEREKCLEQSLVDKDIYQNIYRRPKFQYNQNDSSRNQKLTKIIDNQQDLEPYVNYSVRQTSIKNLMKDIANQIGQVGQARQETRHNLIEAIEQFLNQRVNAQ